eukprot:scaffold1071_cov252-Pinguiococcus_pyrenoidosus.AAC.2
MVRFPVRVKSVFKASLPAYSRDIASALFPGHPDAGSAPHRTRRSTIQSSALLTPDGLEGLFEYWYPAVQHILATHACFRGVRRGVAVIRCVSIPARRLSTDAIPFFKTLKQHMTSNQALHNIRTIEVVHAIRSHDPFLYSENGKLARLAALMEPP